MALKSFVNIKSLIGIVRILNLKEKLLLAVLFLVFIFSTTYILLSLYYDATTITPAFGGTYKEGVVGQPRFINPIYSQASDADRDLVEILFAGLMKYDAGGKIVPDLARNYEIRDNGKVYEFTLNRAVWSDGAPLNADDVIFTVKTIQDASYQSPIMGSWLGVSAEKISDDKIMFRLPKSYSAFLELTTLKIIPQHIWRDISPGNFYLSSYNLDDAVSSGPYKLKTVSREKSERIKSIGLTANPSYFGQKPFLRDIIFFFFDSENDLVTAAQNGTIHGFAPQLNKQYILHNFTSYRLNFLRYFAIFINGDELDLLKEVGIRKALNYATNRQEIVDKLFSGQASRVTSPVMPEIFEFAEPKESLDFNPGLAKEILDKSGFAINPDTGFRQKAETRKPTFQFKSDLAAGSQGKEVEELQKCLARDPAVYPDGSVTGHFGDKTKSAVVAFQEKYADEILTAAGLKRGNGKVGPATRAKLNSLCFPTIKETLQLAIALTTASESPLPEIAQLIKSQWEAIGIKVEVEELPAQELVRDRIKTRNYQALLFGQVLGTIPDPLPFWHSSQRKDPGLNLTNFGLKEADVKLTAAREAQNNDEIKSALEGFQNILLKEYPAVFLVRPDYVYMVSPSVKGLSAVLIVDPSKRFAGLEAWYMETRRVFK